MTARAISGVEDMSTISGPLLWAITVFFENYIAEGAEWVQENMLAEQLPPKSSRRGKQ